MRLSFTLAGLLALTACRASGSSPAPGLHQRAALDDEAKPSGAAAPPTPRGPTGVEPDTVPLPAWPTGEPWPGLTLDITPDPARAEATVAVRVSGEHAAAVREITVARAWADARGAETLSAVRAHDVEGEIPLQPHADDGGPDDVYGLARAPVGGDFALVYRAHANAGRSRFALRVAEGRLSGVGHTFLLLPRIEKPVPARVRIHAGALGSGADAASSFGFGAETVTSATSEDLAHAVYVAGMLWREGSTSPELVVLGDPPFDTHTAWDHAVRTSAAVDRFFLPGLRGPADPAPFIFVLVAQRDLGAARDGAYLTRSLGVWFDAHQPLDGELDLVMAHELTHRFLGGTVRLIGRDEREATWFSEGFTVHFARRALLDAGLLTPAVFVADVNRSLDGGNLPADYRRGALHAAWLDAAVRRASHGRRSLDDVVRELVAGARSAGVASFPVTALRDALAREIGPEGAAHIDRLEADDDAPVDLPDDAFGPCARRAGDRRTAFDLGFERGSLDLQPAVVRGVEKGSAAERAGVREGSLVLRARVPEEAQAMGSARAEVELLLAPGRRIRYRPVGTKRVSTWVPAPCHVRAAGRASSRRAP